MNFVNAASIDMLFGVLAVRKEQVAKCMETTIGEEMDVIN